MLPVVGVVVVGVGRGVNVIFDQPVEVLVATDTDLLHFARCDIGAVSVEVAQNHDVLEQRGGRAATGVSNNPTRLCP